MPFDLIRLALDESMRRYDEEGRMYVKVSHLTKACVNGYGGNEIPDYERLGLDPNRVYMLLRHPGELQKAVPTFNQVQILDQHIPVTASDDSRERVIGSTGTHAVWNAPYIDNSLVFWSDQAIAMIESGQMRELSSAYRYDPVMQPGEYMGQRYDGVMTNIRANHVALVEAGRAGSDVVVMDSKPKEAVMQYLSPRAAYLAGSASAYLMTRMAQDQKVPDLKPIFAGVTAKNWSAKKQGVVAAITRVTRGKLAQDAEVHIHEHLDGAGAAAPPDLPGAGAPPGGAPDADLAFGGAAAEDPNATEDNPVADPSVDPATDVVATVQQLLQGNIDDNTLAIILNALKNPPPPEPEPEAEAAPPEENGGSKDNKGATDEDCATDEDGEIEKLGINAKGNAMDKRPVTRVAMDAAIEKAVKEAVDKVTLRLNKRDDAQKFVRPWIGDIAVAMDSAHEVYKFALEQMGEDVGDIHPSAYKAILNKIPKPGEQQSAASRTVVAMDRDTNKQYLERFPHANRLMKH